MSGSGPYRSQPATPESRRRADRLGCPGCSREVADSLRICPHCGTPIATVRCGSCFHMSPPDSALCTGCGRELGLEPVAERDSLTCPDCKLAFQCFEGGPGLLHDCGRCGGQFVDHALLRDLLAQRELYGRAAPRPPPRHNPMDSPIRYVACPVCQEIMSRRNFGRSSGVIVDVCAKHGVWFDRGELPRVLEFVESGGLELARLRAADERHDSQRRQRVEAFEKSIGSMHAPASWNPAERARQSYEAADASLTLLGVLSELLGER